jgi:hypothetical protein
VSSSRSLVADRPKSRSIQQAGSTRAALLQLTLFGPTRWVLNQSTTDIMQATVARLIAYTSTGPTHRVVLCAYAPSARTSLGPIPTYSTLH